MSFAYTHYGYADNPGYFLVNDENCERLTCTVDDNMDYVASGDRMIVLAGDIYPKNDHTALGFIYENVDITFGEAPASYVSRGSVVMSRLPYVIDDDAKTALKARGFVFVDEENEVPKTDEENETPK